MYYFVVFNLTFKPTFPHKNHFGWPSIFLLNRILTRFTFSLAYFIDIYVNTYLYCLVCALIVIVIQSAWRGMKGRRKAKRRRQAADLIRRCLPELLSWLPCVYDFAITFWHRLHTSLCIHPFDCRFIKGFIYRHEEYCPENEYFLDHVRYSFLKNLRKNLPRNVLDKSWPTPPPSLVEVKTDNAFKGTFF